MRGDAGVPEIVHHVELADGPDGAEFVHHEFQLVVERVPAELQRLLVEGGEGDRIDPPLARQPQGRREVLQHRATAGRRHLPHPDRRGVEVLHVEDDDRRIARQCRRQAVDRGKRQAHAGHDLARLQDPAVADDDDPGIRRQFRVGQQLRHQFPADAGRVAHHQCQTHAHSSSPGRGGNGTSPL
jgi:hypothetical protein